MDRVQIHSQQCKRTLHALVFGLVRRQSKPAAHVTEDETARKRQALLCIDRQLRTVPGERVRNRVFLSRHFLEMSKVAAVRMQFLYPALPLVDSGTTGEAQSKSSMALPANSRSSRQGCVPLRVRRLCTLTLLELSGGVQKLAPFSST